ncbi:MAG: AMP-binding protein [Flavobacteriales bacterium]
MTERFKSLMIDGQVLTGDALVDHAIALRRAHHDADWTCAYQGLIDELVTSDAPLSVLTSGTTGPAKRITLDRADLWASAQLTGRTFNLKAGDRALLCLPCDFIAGKMMVVRAMALGLDLHISDPRGSVLENLNTQDLSRFTAMVPLQLHRAISEDRALVEQRFGTILLGGGPVSDRLVEDLRELRTSIHQSYGSTETLTHVALRALNGPSRSDAFHALGEVTFGLDVRGCLVIYTPHLSTPQHITNDLVELIDDRHFLWMGRWDNVILSGGKKIFPEQLEARTAALLPYPHYFTAASDDRLGQAVVLVLETDRPRDEVVPEVMSTLITALDEHELPRRVRTVPSFDRTGSGKVIRKG